MIRRPFPDALAAGMLAAMKNSPRRLALSLLLAAGFFSWPVASQPKADWLAAARTGCQVWNSQPQYYESATWSGPCVEGKAAGSGVLQWFETGKPTDKYEGEMLGGMYNGRGKLNSATGDSYDGEWKDDKPHGRGTFVRATGSRYEGEWIAGERSGRGVLTTRGGGNYDGEWLKDQRHGKGTFVYSSGDRYEGEWRDDERNGRGVYTWKAGARYDGEWRNGRAEGQGTYTAGSETYTGIWRNGCFDHDGRQMWLGGSKEACGFK